MNTSDLLDSVSMLKLTTRPPLPKPQYQPNPKFGSVFAPHMFRMEITAGQTENKNATYEAAIIPFASELFSPATLVFHYGQTVFEGMKAFIQKDGSVAMFRADLHARRFGQSAARMAMPVIPEALLLECLQKYVAYEKESVPMEADHALYLRPLLIARDQLIKVSRSHTYTFYILGCIVGNYFPGGALRPAKVLVNRQFVRAFPGGLGEAKTAANYAASLAPQSYAEGLGYDQVLYLDAIQHENVDELGGMNFFILKNGELITPPLNSCILNGVTRRSILEIAPTLGIKAREENISFTQLCKDIQNGTVTEAFACGTAAVIHPIGELGVQEKMADAISPVVLPKNYSTALKILETLKNIQRGHHEAPGKWLWKV